MPLGFYCVGLCLSQRFPTFMWQIFHLMGCFFSGLHLTEVEEVAFLPVSLKGKSPRPLPRVGPKTTRLAAGRTRKSPLREPPAAW